MNATTFPRILLGPGPSGVTPRVLEALGRAPIGYLDPELFHLVDGLRADLRQVFGTTNPFTLAITGTGMAGMECCLSNVLEPGDPVIVGIHGFFGGRIAEICRRLGAEVTEVHAEWGSALDPEQIEAALKPLKRVKLVACVHAETSTGVEQPLEAISNLAHEHDALFLVDAVTSLGGIPVEIDKRGIDVCYSGTQKCLGAPPGLAPITVSERALEVAARRKTPPPVWYFDWNLLRAYYDEPHAYHHTVPVNLLFALREALAEIMEEGLDSRFARHRQVSRELIEGLQQLGISPFVPESLRLPMLNTVKLPAGVEDEAGIRRQLLQVYGLEIGGGLGSLKGKIWRIGVMGASATHRNITLLLAALRETLTP